MASEAKCPFMHTAGGARSNRDWWPNQLNLKLLREFDPMEQSFNYAKEFKSLNLAAVKKDLTAVMTDSQDWWPADFGTTGLCSFAWPGTPPARTASATAAAAPGPASSASRLSTAGPTT